MSTEKEELTEDSDLDKYNAETERYRVLSHTVRHFLYGYSEYVKSTGYSIMDRKVIPVQVKTALDLMIISTLHQMERIATTDFGKVHLEE
jgi:hypothetical protein